VLEIERVAMMKAVAVNKEKSNSSDVAPISRTGQYPWHIKNRAIADMIELNM
jgi:hypothetical protein